MAWSTLPKVTLKNQKCPLSDPYQKLQENQLLPQQQILVEKNWKWAYWTKGSNLLSLDKAKTKLFCVSGNPTDPNLRP